MLLLLGYLSILSRPCSSTPAWRSCPGVAPHFGQNPIEQATLLQA